MTERSLPDELAAELVPHRKRELAYVVLLRHWA